MRAIASIPRSGREPWAAKPSVSISKSDEALMGDREPLLGRLRHDHRVRAPPGRDCGTSDARELLVGDGGDDHVAAKRERQRALGGEQRRRQARLHVVGAPSVDPSVVDTTRQRLRHARDTDGVHVSVQHQRLAATRATRRRNHVWPARSGFLELDLQARAFRPPCHKASDLGLARSSCNQPGIDRLDPDELARQLRE